MKKTLLIITSLLVLLSCRERIVSPEYLLPGWITLISDDKDDPQNADIKALLAKVSDTTIEFMVITHECWKNPREDVDFGIFMDTDQNPATGLSSKTPNWNYTVNDIGADYIISCGFESASDSLLSWKKDRWTNSRPLAYISFLNDSDTLKCGIKLEWIGNPSSIDIILIEAFPQGGFDYAPEEGHVTIDIKRSLASLP